ncbi:hypothetical protein K474DRAFT_1603944 [Panus rudis PR-1116 ss-1]|nr:hypothetical protein K474DRAFT_1603944 [Panus rudis PR-1116 ss-1]
MDGNLVVRVDGVHFKLHRSRMVRNSTFFKEQVEIARAEMGMIRHDHIFVQVKGVSVQDFERLLEALDVGVGYVFNPPPFHIIASVLRAARTLGFTTLEAWATHTLRNMWPESYEGITSTPIQHGAETIGITRDCNIPSLLKPAFYQLVRTTAFGQNLDEEEEENQEDAKRRTLKRQDLIRLVRMREEFHIAWVEAADSPPSKALFPCPLEVPVDRQDPASDNVDQTNNSPPVDPIKNKCLKARANSFQIWHAEVKESGIFEEHLYDPIVGLDKLSKIKWEDHGFCEGCVKSWRNHWELEKKRIWDRMDITLELHPSVVES